MNLNCCLPKIHSQVLIKKSNLLQADDANSKLLFLYRWLEQQGKNLKFYPNVIDNIKVICPEINCCDEEEIDATSELQVSVSVVCNDQIFSDSFVIY